MITTVAGNGEEGFSGDGGPAAEASLSFPVWVAFDVEGNLFIPDYGNHRIRRVDVGTGIITTVAGNGEEGFSGDGGPATEASFSSPLGVAVDAEGNLFIADEFNHRVRRVDADSGIITTVAGNGTEVFSGDGGPATEASLYYPTSISLDTEGSLFISDFEHHRVRVVKGLDPEGLGWQLN